MKLLIDLCFLKVFFSSFMEIRKSVHVTVLLLYTVQLIEISSSLRISVQDPKAFVSRNVLTTAISNTDRENS